MKRLPYAKTVVAEFKVHLADLLSRSVRMKGSVAVPIPLENTFNNGDCNVTEALPYTIQQATNVVIINSLEKFVVTLTQAGQTITVQCDGLFLHTGAIEQVVITPIAGVSTTRIHYIWS